MMLKELDILYKKVAKIALGVSTRESSITVLYKDMEWLPLHLRRQLHLSAYIYIITWRRTYVNLDHDVIIIRNIVAQIS